VGTITIQVPDGWLQMTRAEYKACLVPKILDVPRLLTAKQMEAATSIPARRWIELAKRNEIPFVSPGERGYRFNFEKVSQHLEVAPATTSALPKRMSMKEAMKTVG
jgi:hypothetical protein